jgi:uncharacterized protein YjbI with pentapeptide repeats
MSEIKPENIIAVDLVRPRRLAQTLDEMEFALSLRPCGTCGEFQRDPMQFHSTGPAYDETRELIQYWTECLCPGCGSKRQLVSWTVPNPRVGTHRFQLVGASPSQLIEPWQFMAELDRLSPLLHSAPCTLSFEPFDISYYALQRALTCAIELRKFVVPGQPHLLKSEYTDAGRAHRAAHPHRYTATAVQVSHDFLTALYETHMVEIPRIVKESEAAAGPPKVRVGSMDRETVRAHRAWVDRGNVGDGRLILKHQRVKEQPLPGSLLGTQWVGVVLDHVSASYSRLNGSELEQCTFIANRMEGTSLDRCTLLHCTFEDSYLNLISFLEAKIDDCVFTDCEMFRSKWVDAVVRGTTFHHTLLHDARFDGATFTHCTFSGNYIGTTEQFGDLATTAGARFEDCDFRETGWHGRDLTGATFVRCQFAGSGGSPRAHDGLVLEDCDMSREEFLTMLAAADAAKAKRLAEAANGKAD